MVAGPPPGRRECRATRPPCRGALTAGRCFSFTGSGGAGQATGPGALGPLSPGRGRAALDGGPVWAAGYAVTGPRWKPSCSSAGVNPIEA